MIHFAERSSDGGRIDSQNTHINVPLGQNQQESSSRIAASMIASRGRINGNDAQRATEGRAGAREGAFRKCCGRGLPKGLRVAIVRPNEWLSTLFCRQN